MQGEFFRLLEGGFLPSVGMAGLDGVGKVNTCFFDYGEERGGFRLGRGQILPAFRLAYELYGEIAPGRDNVVLLFHALSGSQHAAGWNESVEGVELRWTEDVYLGWWDAFVGPGRAVDTRRFSVLCVNYLGGCYGSTGPSSIDPAKGTPYGSQFPHLTASDIVDSQVALLDHLGIEKVHAVIGNSVGGLLALNFAVRYPDRVRIVIPVATGISVSVLQRIMSLEQIVAIENDPDFRGGDYYDGRRPDRGLALARMISHKTFISLDAIERRARREVVGDDGFFSWYGLGTPLESYMLHQGLKFVKRFDANTYLRVLDIWQKFDLLEQCGEKSFEGAFARCRHQRYMVYSIDSDVCFYPEQQRELVAELRGADVPVMHITVHSDKGHDSFLLEPSLFTPHLAHTLNAG